MTPQTVAPNKPGNPVAHYHERRFALGFGTWLSGILVLGLAAAIVAKARPSPLRFAASYNVAAATLQFILIFFGSSKPASETDPRPPQRATAALVVSTLIWAAAFPVMFVFASDDEAFQVLDLKKRGVLDLGLSVVSGLENITLACGAFGVSAFLCVLVQWYYTIRLYQGGFEREHVRAAYHD
ncbi:hypothetical protein ASPVEDRAFT_52545 [Aspergillus versicolor CBS 583.65]|uniref:MARVEL domain-containing protein n=1 Tax=Aspergillus versicolor CBS 583.65 TaxID=1036611 RepID=A0A1L9PJE3_ASPVE|nr:uncharacterized protein ASPVEDRAFT_52545 [Aspergillus versicolor CBS 583.65]OJJ01632.1 hypothetical protein ASPVEDRAFT_52545 [Aspergillus versicolor CBS 583.65]